MVVGAVDCKGKIATPLFVFIQFQSVIQRNKCNLVMNSTIIQLNYYLHQMGKLSHCLHFLFVLVLVN